MTHSDDPRRQHEALRHRVSALKAALLRIGASLDPGSVLAEVMESARGITGTH